MGCQIVNKPPRVRVPLPLGERGGRTYTGWSFGCPVCDRIVRVKHTPGIVDAIETCGDHTFRVHWCDDCPTCGT